MANCHIMRKWNEWMQNELFSPHDPALATFTGRIRFYTNPLKITMVLI